MTLTSKKLSFLAMKLQDFLNRKKLMDYRLLLGFSMGVDSLCLFHLLLELQKRSSLQFAVAHVNHNWRATAGSEAKQIERYVASHKLPFHLHSLDPKQMRGNLENACREERLRFFTSLCQNHAYHGVLLAHHRQDQVETLLKRLFEGKFSSGMQEEKKIGDLNCYRPLLTCSKESLQAYLEQRGLEPLEDSSNSDEHFLRVRMRKQLSPYLCKIFGKGVEGNILHLAKKWEQLQDFTHECMRPLLQVEFEGPLGAFYSFKSLPHPYLLNQWIEKLYHSLGAICSRELSHQFVKALEEKKPSQSWKVGEKTLYVDRQRVWLSSLPLSHFILPLSTDSPFSLYQSKAKALRGNWKDFLRGYFYLSDSDDLNGIKSFSLLEDKSLIKAWKSRFSKQKIPRWLWPYIPMASCNAQSWYPLLYPFRKAQKSDVLYGFQERVLKVQKG